MAKGKSQEKKQREQSQQVESAEQRGVGYVPGVRCHDGSIAEAGDMFFEFVFVLSAAALVTVIGKSIGKQDYRWGFE